jgi:hypothetical protein
LYRPLFIHGVNDKQTAQKIATTSQFGRIHPVKISQGICGACNAFAFCNFGERTFFLSVTHYLPRAKALPVPHGGRAIGYQYFKPVA